MNWKWMMSPSLTTYVLPSCRYLPAAFTSAILLPVARDLKSSYATTSALMNPRSKSEWITPAACGASEPEYSVQHRTSFSPAVK